MAVKNIVRDIDEWIVDTIDRMHRANKNVSCEELRLVLNDDLIAHYDSAFEQELLKCNLAHRYHEDSITIEHGDLRVCLISLRTAGRLISRVQRGRRGAVDDIVWFIKR